MPELPEVETTVRGIASSLESRQIIDVIVRHTQLRWLIAPDLKIQLLGQKIVQCYRRAKYIIIQMTGKAVIIHLGMSGRLCLLTTPRMAQKHDHVDIVLENVTLRYTDPRRFGAIILTHEPPLTHPLLKNLGPEPLLDSFDSAYLLKCVKACRSPIKSLIMNSKIVVGVGNIYASEALFLARIHPLRRACDLSTQECEALVQSIKEVLTRAIATGGSTLKDFFQSDGKPGYFTQHLNVYGRNGKLCYVCQHTVQSCTVAQRNTFFCDICQT